MTNLKTPITPQQALGNKMELEREAINQLIETCNKRLTEHWDGRTAVRVNVNGVNKFVRDKVIELFSTNWNVKWDSGSSYDRSNDLVFTAKMDTQSYYDK